MANPQEFHLVSYEARGNTLLWRDVITYDTFLTEHIALAGDTRTGFSLVLITMMFLSWVCGMFVCQLASNWPASWVISLSLAENICNVTTGSHLDCTNFYQWTAFSSSTSKYHRPDKVISRDWKYFGAINQESDSLVSRVQLWFLISVMKNTAMSSCHSHLHTVPAMITGWFIWWPSPLMIMMLI